MASKGAAASLKETVWRILGYVFSTPCSKLINWSGINQKMAFRKTFLKSVLFSECPKINKFLIIKWWKYCLVVSKYFNFNPLQYKYSLKCINYINRCSSEKYFHSQFLGSRCWRTYQTLVSVGWRQGWRKEGQRVKKTWCYYRKGLKCVIDLVWHF